MTQEEKEILVRDLCARLPYQVKAELHGEVCTVLGYVDDYIILTSNAPMGQQTNIVNVKPYLRPLSSMMRGEWEEMTALIYPYGRVNGNSNNKNELLLWLSAEGNDMPIILMDKVFSWLNKNMFDYRNLIPMGLAIEAPEGMYREVER